MLRGAPVLPDDGARDGCAGAAVPEAHRALHGGRGDAGAVGGERDAERVEARPKPDSQRQREQSGARVADDLAVAGDELCRVIDASSVSSAPQPGSGAAPVVSWAEATAGDTDPMQVARSEDDLADILYTSPGSPSSTRR